MHVVAADVVAGARAGAGAAGIPLSLFGKGDDSVKVWQQHRPFVFCVLGGRLPPSLLLMVWRLFHSSKYTHRRSCAGISQRLFPLSEHPSRRGVRVVRYQVNDQASGITIQKIHRSNASYFVEIRTNL